MLELLPESGANILGLRAWGTVTLEDFRQTLAPRLAAMIEDRGKARMLLYLEEDFHGFDLAAFKVEAAFGSKHRDNLEKIALVGGSWIMNLQIRLASSLLGGELQTFDREELAAAWEWVRG
jgi:hypothetical protein